MVMVRDGMRRFCHALTLRTLSQRETFLLVHDLHHTKWCH